MQYALGWGTARGSERQARSLYLRRKMKDGKLRPAVAGRKLAALAECLLTLENDTAAAEAEIAVENQHHLTR